MLYEQKISDLLRKLDEFPIGEAFEGHPDDPSILEEYYLYDAPENELELLRALTKIIDHKFELRSNVITIYK